MTSADATRVATAAPTLKLTEVSKGFGPIQAVKKISLAIPRNEVLGLIGENGAGKSSLLKILTGIHQPDSGTIEVNGEVQKFRRPQDAAAAGIGVVHQEQSLLTNLSVAENIAMNATGSKDQATRFGWYRWGQLNEEAIEVLDKVGAKIDPRTIVGDLSFVDRQMVEIARALRVDEITHAAPLVILDEPTSVLERDETEILEREIRKLKDLGSVIFVSHRLDEVLRICDRIVVMRHGELVADRKTDAVSEDELFKLMIGHVSQAEKHPRDPRSSTAKPALDVKGLGQQHVFKDVSFSVWPGRIVTIIGTMGSGRESVCRALFGAEAFDEGILELNGRQIRSWSVSEAVHNGVGYLPAERKVEGMVGWTHGSREPHPYPSRKKQEGLIPQSQSSTGPRQGMVRATRRPTTRPEAEPGTFLGGQSAEGSHGEVADCRQSQGAGARPPLRGLDPGAKETVNAQIREACKKGAGVVLVPDTLEEALDMGDEILVMRDGEVTARFDTSRETPTSLDLLERMV